MHAGVRTISQGIPVKRQAITGVGGAAGCGGVPVLGAMGSRATLTAINLYFHGGCATHPSPDQSNSVLAGSPTRAFLGGRRRGEGMGHGAIALIRAVPVDACTHDHEVLMGFRPAHGHAAASAWEIRERIFSTDSPQKVFSQGRYVKSNATEFHAIGERPQRVQTRPQCVPVKRQAIPRVGGTADRGSIPASGAVASQAALAAIYLDFHGGCVAHPSPDQSNPALAAYPSLGLSWSGQQRSRG